MTRHAASRHHSSIKSFYTDTVRDEWHRLTKSPVHRLEYDCTMRFLKEYLPKKGLVLDAGGGPGRYTIALAGKGYDMVLFDYTPANLEFAKRAAKRANVAGRLRGVEEGRIEDLSRFKSNTFDAVMCLGGPLSHVMDRKGRERAVGELIRVAKHGAPIFVSVMNRMSMMAGYTRMFQNELEAPYFKNIFSTGDYPGGYGFTPFHGFMPEEFRGMFERRGVKLLELVGLEGFSSYSNEAVRRLYRNKKRWNIWLKTHNALISHPVNVGVSMHMLAVCRKV